MGLSVNRAKSSTPNVDRMLKEAKKTSLTNELNRGPINRLVTPSA